MLLTPLYNSESLRMAISDVVKIILIAIIEGITEWLPVSSTGHIIIFERFFTLSDDFTDEFKKLFDYVIQLGAITSVPILFRDKLFSFKRQRKQTVELWVKVVIASIPAVAAIALDNLFESFGEKVQSYIIASALIFYGIVFVVIEKIYENVTVKRSYVRDVTYCDSLKIGGFQALAAIPGTSRSGITIIGGRICGLSRQAATELSFYLAIPAIVGASGYKTLKFALSGVTLTFIQANALLLGFAVSFAVSMFVIKLLTNFVKTRGFTGFGVYRILLGVSLFIIL
mgnify:FL=1